MVKSFQRIIATALLSSLVITASAEDAPVYDVDNYPPQFDSQSDGGMKNASSLSAQSAPLQPSAVASPSLTLDQRVGKVEQQMNNLQHSDWSTKMAALQNEVQALRGQVDELNHQLQQMQTQQRSMYSDFDRRLSKQQAVAASAPAPAEISPPSLSKLKKSKKLAVAESVSDDQPVVAPPKPDAALAAAPKVDAATEQAELQMNQAAYDLINSGKFDQAINTLQNMLKKYPTGQSVANAHYWLGELYELQKKHDQSATEFAIVVKNYPNSPKVSDAEVKLGMIYMAQLKWPAARSTFKKVISHYPGTTSARLAAQQLKELQAMGH